MLTRVALSLPLAALAVSLRAAGEEPLLSGPETVAVDAAHYHQVHYVSAASVP